jgi:hypothetical protein
VDPGKITILTFIAATVGLLTPAANACSWNVVTVVDANGKVRPETAAEAQRRERKYAKIAIKKNEQAAKLLLANGKVDVAGELASLLIPNVRSEDDGMRSSCGGWDGQDFATKNDSVIQDKDFEKALSGDPLAQKLMAFHQNRPHKFYQFNYFGYPAKRCNVEFRQRFKAFLISRHSMAELEKFWLFLKPRNRVYEPSSLLPMMEFDRGVRKPPSIWSYSRGRAAWEDVNKWDSKQKGEGAKLRNSLTAYWAIEGSSLDDSWAVCPNAMNGWKPAQDPESQRIIAWDEYQERARSGTASQKRPD